MSYSAIGLFQPKNNINIGAVLRAADVYGAAFVAATGRRYKRASTDTTGALHRIPLFRPEDLKDVVPFGCVPVAVELLHWATPLPSYTHPQNAFYIFGPEDGVLGHAVTGWCRDVVYVPTGCMNLAATVNVVLYDRLAKSCLDPNLGA